LTLSGRTARARWSISRSSISEKPRSSIRYAAARGRRTSQNPRVCSDLPRHIGDHIRVHRNRDYEWTWVIGAHPYPNDHRYL
jgi:hypothetical protein